ncbi:unnamed protein product [Auanema sp. JU1783]|nr:unnamed protein product [Auanema sp. JU1783]
MISFWRQLRFLLWKGVLIKKRQKFWLAIEIIVPIILFAILALVRTKDFTDSRLQCHYDSKGLPSSGILPFLHSFLCSFSNACSQSPTTGDELLYINNGTTKHESILVDFLYYSSLQFNEIGSNPAHFQLVLKKITKIIQIIANIDGTSMSPLTISNFYDPTFNVTRAFTDMGVTPTAALAITQATLTSQFFLETFQFTTYIKTQSLLSLLVNDPEIPFLCDKERFSASFHLQNGTSLTSDDMDSLCKLTVTTFAAHSEFRDNLKPNFQQKLKTRDGSSIELQEIINLSNEVYGLVGNEPIVKLFSKYSNVSTDVVNWLFCGNNPYATSAAGLTPPNVGPETAFDRMRKSLIKFIEQVVPGQDKKHDKQFCKNVPVHEDLNCSSLENAVLRRLRPIFQGYILVSPRSSLTEELVDMLNIPLQQLDFLRRAFYIFPSIADEFQDSLYKSDLHNASQNILDWLKKIHPPTTYPTPWLDSIEFVLQHIFNDSTDPDSLGEILKHYIGEMNKYTSCFLMDRFVFVDSDKDMEEAAVCLMEYDQYFSGIVFPNMTSNSSSFGPFNTYKIRHHPQLVDSTDALADSSKRPFSRDQPFQDLKYITYGFVFLQEAVNRAIIKISTNKSVNIGIYAQQEPYPCAQKDNFNVSNFLGLFVILSFLIPASLLVKNIVFEKEHRLKEQMRIMGLGDTVHFVSWAIVSLVLNMISVIIISIILKYGRIFDHSDFTLLFLFLSLFALSSIALALFLSTFFTNANISTAATCIVYFLFFFPFQLSVKSKNRVFSQFTLMFPQTTLGYGALMLASANEAQQASWHYIHKIYLPAYDVSLIQCMIAFAIQTVVFCVLAWYISAIAPGVYGVSQPLYFPFTRRYWFPNSCTECEEENVIETFDQIQAGDCFESDPHDLKMTVRVKSMSKIYKSGTKALNQLNLRLYENHVTALLGHNGAGKTTTMSILCGLYSPTAGTASIYGYDIRQNMRKVRDVLGICPQYNVIFTLLTVREQLRFFAALKGCADSKLEEEVNSILQSVKLSEKADCLAGTLSGGMKRRLCIGIAFIGNSKFVILDEPTAGVDVNSRKDIWRLLQENKIGRTILLSTHHMDEADVLSDRIAVLSEGELVTLGSPVFLKNRFGENLELVACKARKQFNYADIIKSIISLHDVGLFVKDENEEEITFRIPLTTDSCDLAIFFDSLDRNLSKFQISGYGISAPTLQQIFIKLAPQREYNVPKVHRSVWATIKSWWCCRSSTIDTENTVLLRDVVGGSQNIAAAIPTNEPQNNPIFEEDCDLNIPSFVSGGIAKLHGQCKALFACRWQYTWRSRKTTFFEVILPILLLMACELYTKIAMGNPSSSFMISQFPLPLVNGLFGNFSDTYINVLDRNSTTYSYGITKSLSNSPGMGTRCSTNQPKLFDGISCAKGVASGSFNWTNDGSSYNYNEDVICECTANIGWNCTMEDYPLWSLDHLELNTTDRMWDLSFRNLSQLRMDTRWSNNDSIDSPYFLGGFSLGHLSLRARNTDQVQTEQNGWRVFINGISESAKELSWNISSIKPSSPLIEDPFVENITTASFVDNVLANMDVRQNAKVWFNNKAWPSLPIYLSNIYNAILRYEDNKHDPNDLGILTINHPMNETVRNSFDNTAIQKIIVFRIVIIVLVLSIIPAGFTVFLVQDRITDSYHLQIVSGLSRKTYWVTSYVFDMAIYIVAIVVIILAYAAFGVKEFTYDSSTAASFFLLFFIYGLCAVLWAYVLQRWFVVPALSFVLIAVGTFFVGIVGSMTVIMIEQMMKTDPTLQPYHTAFSVAFLIVPQYNLGMAVFRGSYVYQLVQMGERYLIDLNRPDLISSLPLPYIIEWNLMGMHCVVLLLHICIAASLLIVLEGGSFGFLRRKERIYTEKLLNKEEKTEENDIESEKERALVAAANKTETYPLVVSELAKAYSSSTLAVKGVSFIVEKGECFGLLGLNGAGKTTTFGMLTGKIFPGAGYISLNGSEVSGGNSKDFTHIGYCPQFDALNTQLTTRENLIFFARIRGIPEQYIPKLASRLLRSLHLRPYSHTLTGSLSGGNKRKLSVAIALISQPSLILLDEPSAGMDPGSQQFLWKVIDKLRRSGKAVVMTSHSMEECEALCTRIAIMDRGRIRCLGSKQHLKNKFGQGYSLTLKLCNSSDTSAVVKLFKSFVSEAHLEAVHCSTIFFQIPRECITIANILHNVNRVKSEYKLEDFSLSQSTLDEIFQSLASRSWETSQNPSRATQSSILSAID